MGSYRTETQVNGLQVPEVHLTTTETEVPAGTITCPNCNYTGFGFSYVEFGERSSPITDKGVIRMDLAEPKYDSDNDLLQCPHCQRRFQGPKGLELSIEFGDGKS